MITPVGTMHEIVYARGAVKAALLLVCLLLLAVPASAEVRRLCDVSYQRADGSWSEPARTEVTFLTWTEVRGGDSSAPHYAAVRFEDGETAMLLHDGLHTVVDVGGFSNTSFQRVFALAGDPAIYRQVNGGNGRRWRVSGRDALTGNYIDPRAARGPFQ